MRSRRDFLPRGTGIVTRRPLLLQLHQTIAKAPAPLSPATVDARGAPRGWLCHHVRLTLPARAASAGAEDAGDGGGAPEWGEFVHKPGKKYFDFNDIRSEVRRARGSRGTT